MLISILCFVENNVGESQRLYKHTMFAGHHSLGFIFTYSEILITFHLQTQELRVSLEMFYNSSCDNVDTDVVAGFTCTCTHSTISISIPVC